MPIGCYKNYMYLICNKASLGCYSELINFFSHATCYYEKKKNWEKSLYSNANA